MAGASRSIASPAFPDGQARPEPDLWRALLPVPSTFSGSLTVAVGRVHNIGPQVAALLDCSDLVHGEQGQPREVGCGYIVKHIVGG